MLITSVGWFLGYNKEQIILVKMLIEVITDNNFSINSAVINLGRHAVQYDGAHSRTVVFKFLLKA